MIFYKDESGEKKDAELHEEMLKHLESNWSGSPAQQRAIHFAMTRLGLSLEEARRVYG